MRLQPLGKNVLIQVTDEEQTTESGIILAKKQQGNIGTVIELAQPHDVLKVGATVYFRPHNHDVVRDGTNTFILTHIDNVIAVEVE